MNILIIEDIASSSFGGAERSMRAFSERLAMQDHKVHLVYDRFGDYAVEDSAPYASISKISTLPLRAQSVHNWGKSVWQLSGLCRLHNIDLILTHVVHSVSMLRIVRALSRVQIAIYFKWVCGTKSVGRQATWGLKGFDGGAAVSKFVADYWIRNGFPAEKMQIVPEGVECESLGEKGQSPGGTDLGRENEKPLNVCFAGRIVKEKGLHVLLDSFAVVSKSVGNINCLIAGAFDSSTSDASSYRTYVMRKIEELGLTERVSFVGYIDPLAPFLRNMDVVVIPSLCQDAQPLVLMQSMAEGVPVLASRVGGIPEVLAGRLEEQMFEPGDAIELSEKILAIAKAPTEQIASLKQRLRSRVVENYNLEVSHRRLSAAVGIR
ncbi:MAG TPA: hypothetical protein DCK93_22070 [Blastocatellia bacterium]|nr:hypothetical protein [Blastocatellia bacterium]